MDFLVFASLSFLAAVLALLVLREVRMRRALESLITKLFKFRRKPP